MDRRSHAAIFKLGRRYFRMIMSLSAQDYRPAFPKGIAGFCVDLLVSREQIVYDGIWSKTEEK